MSDRLTDAQPNDPCGCIGLCRACHRGDHDEHIAGDCECLPCALAASPVASREDEGLRVLKVIERKHQVYADPLGGGHDGYQGACHDCDWRGTVHPRTTTPQPEIKPAARAEASAHEAEAGTVYEVPYQVLAVSPVASRDVGEIDQRRVIDAAREACPDQAMWEACSDDLVDTAREIIRGYLSVPVASREVEGDEK